MSVPVFILPEAGVGTLIGRAWTLVRLNLKATVLLMIAPILLYTLVSILFSVPSGINTLIHTASTQILVLLLSFALLYQRRLFALIQMFAIQSAALAAATVTAARIVLRITASSSANWCRR